MKTQLDPESRTHKFLMKLLKFVLLPLLAFMIILLAIGLATDDDKPEAATVVEVPPKEDHSTRAYMISQNYVKAHLNYPAEADFDFLPDLAEEQEPNLYRIVGSLTSKNAFGVKSEIQYMCRLRFMGGDPGKMESWQLVDISL